MKAGIENGKRRIMAEINMIPLIDVSLVLLIIFMVMTPYLVKSQLKVNLPKAKSGESDSSNEQQLEVQVERTGAITVNGQPVAPAEIEATLRRLLTDPVNQPVVIQADKDVAFEHVVVVMDAAKRIGASKVGVGVKQDVAPKPRKKEEEKPQPLKTP
jgi:biopolymer transport protein TolR